MLTSCPRGSWLLLQATEIISTGPVVGNVSRIMTRHCSMSVAAAPDWDSLFKLDQYCINEVEFWNDNLSRAMLGIQFQRYNSELFCLF